MAKPFKPGFFSNLSGVKDNNDRPPLAGGSGGTTNTFTNLGTGARVLSALVGADVQFRTITSNDPRIVVDETVNNVRVGMNLNWTQGTVAPAGTVPTSFRFTTQTLTGNNTAVTNRFIGVRANSGLTAALENDCIAIGTDPAVLAPLLAPRLPLGETNTASNRGSGEGVFAAKVGSDLQFKSLVAGSNVSLTSDANTITINSVGGGGGGGSNTFSNLGTGQGQVFKQVLVNDVQFRTLRAGSGVTITQDANEVTISASGGGGGSSTPENQKWIKFEDFVSWGSASSSSSFFIGQASGTGAIATNTNNHLYNVRGFTGHAHLESGTTSASFGQIRSIAATQSTFSPGGKVYGAARFLVDQIPNVNSFLALTLYGESSTGTAAGTAMIRLGANLVGVNNWTITIATTSTADAPQVIDTGILFNNTTAIQEIELLFNDVTQTVSAVVNGTAVSYASTYSATQIQGSITSNVATHNAFRFGVYANDNTNSTEARLAVDSVAFGVDLTEATGTGVRRPFTLF